MYYWKIDQRLPLESTQQPSLLQGNKASPALSGELFAQLLSSRLDPSSSPQSTGLADMLSPATVRMLAMALNLNPSASSAPASTSDWIASLGAFKPHAQLPAQPAAAPAASVVAATANKPTGAVHAAAAPTASVASSAEPPAGKAAAAGAPPHIAALIDKAASKYKLDPALLTSVIEQESAFDPKAVSPAGAQGLMQLMPGTAQDLKVKNSFDAAENIDGGSRYLAGLIDRYHGDVKLALAAYNWGMGNLERKHDSMPSETRHYVANIMQNWQQRKSELA